MISQFLKSIFGPQVYRIYHRTPNTLEQVYVSNVLENIGDIGLNYIIPAGALYCVWSRRWNLIIYVGMMVIAAYFVRAVGRSISPTYRTFLQVLNRAQSVFNTENAELLRRYDFEFKHWPVSYKSDKTAAQLNIAENTGSILDWTIGWLVAHTFGIRLVYPGLLLGRFVRVPIEEGRARMVVTYSGARSKVDTCDGNSIDTMFFDRRSEANHKGKTLVITFEGNAGFYEIGMACTPLDAGYSVLGFNHPGFGGSSGTPYPTEELNAAEAVFDYAVKVLGFREEDIVLYAWSIGGFPASHLASSHPRIKALVLDATFDDVLVLALPAMPTWLSGVVKSTIRNHINLHVTKELQEYKGPIRLIRRTEDEIIGNPVIGLKSNRGNDLLVDIIDQRYPGLITPVSKQALLDWLASPHLVDPNLAAASNAEIHIPANFNTLSPDEKSRLAIHIGEKLMTDFRSKHCIPLPASFFQMPWIPSNMNNTST